MHVAEPYLDTSALAKRYIDEAGSGDFDAFLAKWPHARISRLAVVEFRCLLRRRRRTRGDLSRPFLVNAGCKKHDSILRQVGLSNLSGGAAVSHDDDAMAQADELLHLR